MIRYFRGVGGNNFNYFLKKWIFPSKILALIRSYIYTAYFFNGTEAGLERIWYHVKQVIFE